MFGDIEVEQMVFGCSERLHVDVKKRCAIFHGNFLGTLEVWRNDALSSHNHDRPIMNLMSRLYHKCERREHISPCCESI